MLRVWIAEQQLHCSIKIGMYQETMKIPEGVAWGIILADVTRHVAAALATGYSIDESSVVRDIELSFLRELSAPTSDATGDFATEP
jgi:hypothetical protein